MFYVAEIEDNVAIPPDKLHLPLKEVVIELLRKQYEQTILPDVGLIIRVLDADVDPVGILPYGEAFARHKVVFKALIFKPHLQEVVEGDVVDITNFGVFVNIGGLTGFAHISQILNDYIAYDDKHGVLTGQKTGRVLAIGDIVRCRVVSVSIPKRGAHPMRIALTMRQPYLGKIDWILEDIGLKKKEEKDEKGEGM